MNYATVCSGIEAPTQAWHSLGWVPQFFSEIEPFPSALLAHHYPNVPNYGDMTQYKDWPDHDMGLICGGTPCQAFSVAGLRKGLDDPRGNLTLTFLGIVDRYRPQWMVWENVPGVLSIDGGRTFGTFLGGLGKLGYGFAYRVLDAQYFGVPQRRRRVFVVGYLGDWRRAAAVLFERHSLSGDIAPSREKREVAPTLPSRSTAGGGNGSDFDCDGGVIEAQDVANPLTARMHKGVNTTMDENQTMVAFKASHYTRGKDGAPSELAPPLSADADRGDQDTLVFNTTQITHPDNRSNPKPGEPCHTLNAGDHPPAVAFNWQNGGGYGNANDGLGITEEGTGPLQTAQHPAVAWSKELTAHEECAGTIQRGGDGGRHDGVMTKTAVRRLTPRECERLQGFPDDFTAIPWRNKSPDQCPDGPRYKALGNSMAVPVMRWIGERIALLTSLL